MELLMSPYLNRPCETTEQARYRLLLEAKNLAESGRIGQAQERLRDVYYLTEFMRHQLTA